MDDEVPNSSGSNVISEEKWLSHFQTLHSKSTLNEMQNDTIKLLKIKEQNRHQYTNLDYNITEMEIRNAAKKLKNNKSAFSDRIKNEMLKCSINILLQGFFKTF